MKVAKTKWSTHQERQWMLENLESLVTLLPKISIILGLDPSSSGFGYFGSVNSQVMASGTTGKIQDHVASSGAIFNSLHKELTNMMSHNESESPVILIGYEETSVMSHFKGMAGVAMSKGAAFAAIDVACKSWQIILIPIYISQIKKFLTGNHKADKQEIEEVLKKKGLFFYDDNQADAYGVHGVVNSIIPAAKEYLLEMNNPQFDLRTQKGMRDFENYLISKVGEAPIPLLKDPKLYRSIHGAYVYDKKRKEIQAAE